MLVFNSLVLSVDKCYMSLFFGCHVNNEIILLAKKQIHWVATIFRIYIVCSVQQLKKSLENLKKLKSRKNKV